MSTAIGVDENNDIYIASDGNLAVVFNLDAVAQAAQQAAQAQLGEMVLAVDQGVANFQTVWEASTNIAQFEAYVRRAILSVPGVTEIREFSALIQNNVAAYEATIVTIYGEAAISG